MANLADHFEVVRSSTPSSRSDEDTTTPAQSLSGSISLPSVERLFNASTDAIVLLNRSYNFTFLNRRARELLAAQGELLGANLFERFPGLAYLDSPYLTSFRRSMDEGLAADFEAYYPAPLHAWLRVQSYPADEGIVVFFRDLTAERRAQDELRQKQEEAERQRNEIEALYSTAPIGLALFDTKDFRYLRLNDRQAAFFGLRPEQVVGKTLTDMAPIEGLRELFEQVREGTPVENYLLEGELATHPGIHRYWTVSYFPVFAADGTVQAITAASLEITQQRKAEQALVHSEKLAVVGRLASSIAHEINNPLESVTNLLYLARKSDNLAEIHSYLDTAEREMRRASAITSQTLRFHRQATGPSMVGCSSLMHSVLQIHQGRVLNAHIRVEERHRAGCSIHCFEGEIRQVLHNLVSNAIDAMHARGGRLLLRSRNATDWRTGPRGIVMTVADDGPGMPEEPRRKLFEPFFTTKGLSGTGLGLWISRDIVVRHHGSIRVRSRQGGQRHGTVFTVFLPYRTPGD